MSAARNTRVLPPRLQSRLQARLLLRLQPRLLLRLLLGLLLALQLFALARAPQAWQPAGIVVRLAPGTALTVGRGELAAAQAREQHLQLRRDAAGAWSVRSLPGARPPVLGRPDGDLRLGRTAMAGLRTFQVGAAVFQMLQADGRQVVFTDGERRWRYDGATLYRDGTALPACAGTSAARRVAGAWNRLAPAGLTAARPLLVGGNLYCGNRLGLADTVPGAATIARGDGALWLTAAADGLTPVLAGAGTRSDLRAQALPLAGIETLAVGATRYRLRLAADTLTLTPQRRIALFGVPEVRLPPQVTWQWRQRSLWQGDAATWSTMLAAALALLLPTLAARLTARRPAPRGNILRPPRLPLSLPLSLPLPLPLSLRPGVRAPACWLAATLLAGAGGVSLVVQRQGLAPAAGCSLLLAACALYAWLATPGRLGLAGGAALLLFGTGLLAQLDLGLGAPDTGWLRYYHKTAALLALGSGGAMLWRLQAARGAPLRQRHVEWLLATLAAVALALLAAQVLWGDETGVFDLQPVELAKLVLAGLTAHCLALRMGWRFDHAARPGLGARWLRLLAPALLFIALLGVALVQVDDYSPLILLSLWGGALALGYTLAAGRRWSAALLAGAALAGMAAVPALHAAGDTGLPASFYGDRFQVWLAPERHPHTGQQLLQGGAAIAQGGWFGADGLLGLGALGRGAGGALAIPAVQDDFAPAFFLHRHGLVAGLLLWCLQAAVLAGLCATAWRCARAGAQAGGFRAAWRARLQAFLLGGGAAFLAGHLMLSWGTNLAIVPVMGQPMSFLSAGGSHLLFFLLPLLGIHAAATTVFHPSPSSQE